MTMTKLLRLILVALILPSSAHGAQVWSRKFSLKTDKVVRVEGGIDDYTVLLVKRAMERTKNVSGDRMVIIDSPGGSTDEAELIWDMLAKERANTGRRIVCVVTGDAASMAFNLLSRCDVRLGVSSSTYLFHDVYYQAPMFSRLPKVQMYNLKQALVELENINLNFAFDNAAALHIPVEEYIMLSAEGDRYTWTAGTLLTKGYLTAIVKFVE